MAPRNFSGWAFLLAALTAAASAGSYYPDPAIVWPTYLLVEKSYDAQLTCPRLASEIAKVESDITLLKRAQVRVEDALRISYDTQGSAGREQGGAMLNTAITRAGFLYTEGREQIRESRRIAEARRDHLQGLTGSCRAEP